MNPKHKIFSCVLCLICLVCSVGCESVPSYEGSFPEHVAPLDPPGESAPGTQNAADSGAFPENGSPEADGNARQSSDRLFDSGMFPGKIRDLKYAGPGRLLVCADSLFLYDAAADQIIGEYTFPEDDVQIYDFYAISDGYALFGELPENTADGTAQSSEKEDSSSEYVKKSEFTGIVTITGNEEGLRCWIFDETLSLRRSLDLHRLLKAQGYEEPMATAAISRDGTQIAIAGISNLYLYHVDEETLRVLTDRRTTSGSLRYVDPSMVRFTGRKEASSPAEERLIFTGIAIPEGQSDSVPIYGTLNTDGSGLDCHALSDYALSNELIAYEDEVWFPEDFLNATGKLLVTDPTGQIIRTVELEGEDTGKDGVFGSDTGKYLATAAISKDTDDWNGGWRVRIYDAETGKAVWEQNVGTDVSAYQGLSCSVRILDGPRECIVICGRGQNTVTDAYFF